MKNVYYEEKRWGWDGKKVPEKPIAAHGAPGLLRNDSAQTGSLDPNQTQEAER